MCSSLVIMIYNSRSKTTITFVSTLKKAMAPHCSTLAWKIPWTEEPGRLQSTGSQRVRHDWATSFSLLTFMHWRRKWLPTPVFLPGESQGQGNLVGCHLWGSTWLKRLSSSSSSSSNTLEFLAKASHQICNMQIYPSSLVFFFFLAVRS